MTTGSHKGKVIERKKIIGIVWYHPQNVKLRSLAPNNTWTIRTLKCRKMCLLSKTHMSFDANAKEIYKTILGPFGH